MSKLMFFIFMLFVCVELNKADWDKYKELGYFSRTMKKINDKLQNDELTSEEVVDQNQLCGDAHFGKGDASIEKIMWYLVRRTKQDYISYDEMDNHYYSSWKMYNLRDIHNFTYCMENVLLA